MSRFFVRGFLRWSSLFCLPVLLALSGCGSDGTGHGEDYFDHVCAHMQTTENWWGHVIASGDMENPTMTGAEDWLHKRVEVTLDGGGGYVVFSVEDEADHVVGLSEDIGFMLHIYDPDNGNPMLVSESSGEVDACDEVAFHYLYELEPNVDYMMMFGGGGATVGVTIHVIETHDH